MRLTLQLTLIALLFTFSSYGQTYNDGGTKVEVWLHKVWSKAGCGEISNADPIFKNIQVRMQNGLGGYDESATGLQLEYLNVGTHQWWQMNQAHNSIATGFAPDFTPYIGYKLFEKDYNQTLVPNEFQWKFGEVYQDNCGSWNNYDPWVFNPFSGCFYDPDAERYIDINWHPAEHSFRSTPEGEIGYIQAMSANNVYGAIFAVRWTRLNPLPALCGAPNENMMYQDGDIRLQVKLNRLWSDNDFDAGSICSGTNDPDDIEIRYRITDNLVPLAGGFNAAPDILQLGPNWNSFAGTPVIFDKSYTSETGFKSVELDLELWEEDNCGSGNSFDANCAPFPTGSYPYNNDDSHYAGSEPNKVINWRDSPPNKWNTLHLPLRNTTARFQNYTIEVEYRWDIAAPTATIEDEVAGYGSGTGATKYDRIMCVGNATTITANTNGATYFQWQVANVSGPDTDPNGICPGGGTVWTDIAGAVCPMYTPASSMANAIKGSRIYRLKMMNRSGNGSVSSAGDRLNIGYSPCVRVTYFPYVSDIVSTACGGSVFQNATTSFSVVTPNTLEAVINSESLLWEVSPSAGVNISASSSPTTNITFPATTGTYTVKVTVTDACGTADAFKECTVEVVTEECTYVYVSPTGNDGQAGGADSPKGSLSAAVTAAQPGRNHIRMLAGSYSESAIVNLKDNVIVEGGFTIVNGEWVKSSTAQTVITCSYEEMINNNVAHIIGLKSDGKNNWKLRDITIQTVNAAGRTAGNRGKSNYTIWIKNSTGYSIENCRIAGGNASNGYGRTDNPGYFNGVAGGNGEAGNPGIRGANSCGGGNSQGGNGANATTGGTAGSSPVGNHGGLGGNGGFGGAGGNDYGGYNSNCAVSQYQLGRHGCRGDSGKDSGAGIGPGGGAARAGSNNNNCGGSGNGGAGGGSGISGIDGIAGAPGTPQASIIGDFLVPAYGTDGSGGSGGSGSSGGSGGSWRDDCGACDDDSGSGGASGGAGGGGGGGGRGAVGSGSAFTIYHINSTGTYTGNHVSAGNAGALRSGGAGGAGGVRGSQNFGTNNCEGVGWSGNSGWGGTGGAGGNGGDAAAGISAEIYDADAGTSATHGNQLVAPNKTFTAQYGSGCTNSVITLDRADGTVVHKVRYVRLRQNANDWLNIAELQVFERGTGTNISQGKTVLSNGWDHGGSPDKFVNGIWSLNDWAHSDQAAVGEFFQVDLGAEFDVERVRIYDRYDCCHNRSDNLQLILYDAANVELYSIQVNLTNTGTVNVFDDFVIPVIPPTPVPNTDNLASLPGGGSFVEDLSSGESSYTNSTFKSLVAYSSTGVKDLVSTAGTHKQLITIGADRSKPVIDQPADLVTNLCAPYVLNLSSTILPNSRTDTIRWSIEHIAVNDDVTAGVRNPITAVGDADVMTGSFNSTIEDPGSITFTNTSTQIYTYQIKLEAYDKCCGWSVPVYKTINVSPEIESNNDILSTGDTYCALTANPGVILSEPITGGTYNWQVNINSAGFNNVGATGNSQNYTTGTLSVVNNSPTTYEYIRVASRFACVDTSSPIAFTVYPEITDNSMPSGFKLCGGTNPDPLAASAPTGGTGNFTYQWQQSLDNGTTWTDIIGATSQTYDPPYTLTSPSDSTVYEFRRIVSSDKCNSTSSSVRVVVYPDVSGNSIVSPNPRHLCGDGAAVTMVGGSSLSGGNGSFEYVWQTSVNGGPYSVVNGSTFNQKDYTLNLPIVNGNTTTYQFKRLVASGGCLNESPLTDTVVVLSPKSSIELAGSSKTLLSQCEQDGWIYYTDQAYGRNTKFYFAIQKGTNTFDAQVKLARRPNVTDVIWDVKPYTGGNNTSLAHGSFVMRRYWNVDLVTGSIDVNNPVKVRFYYDQAERAATIAKRDAEMAMYPGAVAGGWKWFKTVGQDFVPALINNGNIWRHFEHIVFDDANITYGIENGVQYVEIANVKSFSGGSGATFFGKRNSVLPVEMVSFSATGRTNDIYLEWLTASEVNNEKFEVYRSDDAVNFEKIGEVSGNGTSTEAHQYSFVDADVEYDKLYYYQLKQIDFDGEAELSEIRSAIINAQELLVIGELVPNPATNYTSIEIISPYEEDFKLMITNMLGQEIDYLDYRVIPGSQKIQINIDNMIAGNYLITIHSNNKGVLAVRKLQVVR